MRLFRKVAFLMLAISSLWAWAEESVPKYLQVARDIVANVKPENNVYSNKPRYIRFPDDFLSSGYTVQTDCTGFVEAVLDKGNSITPHFSTRKYPNMYSIIDWVDGVEHGEMFDQIMNFAEIKIGDLLMWKYILFPAHNPPGGAGHIAIVNKLPRKVEPQHAPLLQGAIQWEVEIIDSNASPISPDDTRYTANITAADSDAFKMAKKSGAGRGRLYFYTNERGEIMGMAAAFNRAKILLQDVDRHMVIARTRTK